MAVSGIMRYSYTLLPPSKRSGMFSLSAIIQNHSYPSVRDRHCELAERYHTRCTRHGNGITTPKWQIGYSVPTTNRRPAPPSAPTHGKGLLQIHHLQQFLKLLLEDVHVAP